jgi:galactonate dehydratase
MRKRKAEGFTVIKTGLAHEHPANIVENPRFIKHAVDSFAALRDAGGPDMDIAIDFHGNISPQTAKVVIKELEPYQPMFIEEPAQAQNAEVMADIARGTHLPIATGERIFTKWGFREILEKKAATILQPDLCHAGGLTEGRIIAGMAEAYYVPIAPHNPMGPISLAVGLHLAASIPNFLVQEQVSLGEGYLKKPFVLQKDGTVMIPDGPGLGIELDEDKIKDKIGHNWRNPESYNHLDGSVVDW